MSGGHWGYQQYQIELIAADYSTSSPIYHFLMAAAKSEHIIDWAICGDTTTTKASQELYELWLSVFNKVYE